MMILRCAAPIFSRAIVLAAVAFCVALVGFASGSKNPFQFGPNPASADPELDGASKLTMILILDGREGVALFGSRMLKKGDSIDGGQIIAIEPRSVVTMKNGRLKSYRLGTAR